MTIHEEKRESLHSSMSPELILKKKKIQCLQPVLRQEAPPRQGYHGAPDQPPRDEDAQGARSSGDGAGGLEGEAGEGGPPRSRSCDNGDDKDFDLCFLFSFSFLLPLA